MKKSKSIIYVNFSPYQNVGKIFDFILDNFQYVYIFSFDFHRLGKNAKSNSLKIFINRKLKKDVSLLNLPIPQSLIFLLLPIRSTLIMAQIIFFTYQINKKYGKVNIYFTVNAFTAWVGNTLKRLHLVEKTVFWVWDYYPPLYQDKIVQLMRWIYWQFDKISTKSDNLIFLNKKLEDLRKDIGILPNNIHYKIVPIGTNPIRIKKSKLNKSLRLGFIGVLKKSQGLDIIFSNEKKLLKKYPEMQLEIIGSGPDTKYFQTVSNQSQIKTTFYGLLSEENEKEEKEIQKILSLCDIGIALYVPEETNVSYYGDPSKVKKYLSVGIPVITTNVYAFAQEIKKNNAGIIINRYHINDFINAIDKIRSNYSFYQKNANYLAEKYYYKKIYPGLFTL